MYKLTNNVDVEIIIGQQLSATPRLFLYDVTIYLTTCNSVKEMDHEILTTNGSDRGWLFTEDNDTFRFDIQNNLLTSIYLDYSEMDRSPGDKFELVTEAKKIVGIPKLVQPLSFDLEPFKYRYCAPSDNIWLGYGDIFLDSQGFTELKIAENVSLLFNENNLYCAWLIRSPEQFLVNKIAPIEKYSVTSFLKRSFWDVFQFINEERIELIKKEDIHAFQELRALYKSISNNKEKNLGLNILAEKLFAFANRFSSQEQMKNFQ